MAEQIGLEEKGIAMSGQIEINGQKNEDDEAPERSPSEFTYTYKRRGWAYTRGSSDANVGCCWKRSKVGPPENILVMNEVFDDVWPDRDIFSHEEKQYMCNLEVAFEDGAAAVKDELFTVSRLGYQYRLKALFTFMSHKDADLCLAKPQYLGKMCETALHVSLLFGNSECAKFLVGNSTKGLLMHQYGCTEYRGATALHLAVVNGNTDIIQAMMEKLEPDERVELLHKRATGNFFPEKFAASELALSLSVWTGRLDIFQMLMSYGADVCASEEITGNNIIHGIVNFSKYDPGLACLMCTKVLQCASTWWQRGDVITNADTANNQLKSPKSCTIEVKQKLLWQKNKAGLTPLALAAKTASTEIFDTIINTEDVYRFSQWRYGPASYNYYDVTDIDPSMCSQPGFQSVLEILIYNNIYSSGGSPGFEIFTRKPIEQLLELKWRQMRPWFVSLSLIHAITMCLLLCYIVFRPLGDPFVNITDTSNVTQTHDPPVKAPTEEKFNTNILLWIAQIWVFVIAWVYLIVDLIDLIRSPWYIIKPMVTMTTLEIMFSISTITWFAFKVWKVKEEDLALSIASLTGWAVMQFFLRGIRLLGFFSVMFQNMLFADLPRFAITFGFVLIGFTAAFFVIFQQTRLNATPPEVKNIPITILTLFRLLTGLADFEFIEQSHYPSYCTVLYLVFVLVFNLVLVSMLIALFSDTYTRVAENSNVLWRKLRGAIVLTMERRIRCLYKCHMGLERAFVYEYENDKLKLKWFLPIEDIDFKKIHRNNVG